MGQPSGGWRKSEGDEKKREGALEIEGESWRDVCGGVMGNICVCVCGGLFLCVQQGWSGETQVPADSAVELLWHAVEYTYVKQTHT